MLNLVGVIQPGNHIACAPGIEECQWLPQQPGKEFINHPDIDIPALPYNERLPEIPDKSFEDQYYKYE